MSKGIVLAAVAAVVVGGSAWGVTQYLGGKRDAEQLAALRASAVVGMKDPASAQFRAERVTAAGVLCAEVNVKNGYGGYDGYQRVVAAHPHYVYMEKLGYVGKERDVVDPEASLDRAEVLRDDGPPNQTPLNRVFERHWKEKCS